jgi:hypothetical protein
MRTVCAIILALGVFTAPQVQAEDESPHLLRHYLVKNLIDPVSDFRAVRYSLDPAQALRDGAEGAIRVMPDESEPRLMDGEELLELINKSILFFRDGGDEQSELKIINGRLRVQAPRKVIAQVEKILAALEEEANRSVSLFAVVFRLDPELAKAAGGLDWKNHILTPSRAERFFAALKARPAAVLEKASTSALSGQRVYMSRGRERTYLCDFDAALGEKTGRIDPVVDLLRDGLVLELRPTFGPTGKTIKIDYSLNYSRFSEKAFDTKNPAIGSVDLPRISFFRTGGTAVVAPGGAVLFGPMGQPIKGKTPKDGDKKKDEKTASKTPPSQTYILLRLEATQ